MFHNISYWMVVIGEYDDLGGTVITKVNVIISFLNLIFMESWIVDYSVEIPTKFSHSVLATAGHRMGI
jgi:hypothetical protein